MTSAEFRKILERFHESLSRVGVWVFRHSHQDEDRPVEMAELHDIWCHFNRECKRMEETERSPPCAGPSFDTVAKICHGNRL